MQPNTLKALMRRRGDFHSGNASSLEWRNPSANTEFFCPQCLDSRQAQTNFGVQIHTVNLPYCALLVKADTCPFSAFYCAAGGFSMIFFTDTNIFFKSNGLLKNGESPKR
jgi:hypothetical protein